MTNTDGLRQQIAAALHSVGYRGTESAVTALLPVVTAEELRAAAEELRSDRDDATTGEDPGDPWTYNEAALTCTQRSDALTAEDPS
jgi:hypothetical protein